MREEENKREMHKKEREDESQRGKERGERDWCFDCLLCAAVKKERNGRHKDSGGG